MILRGHDGEKLIQYDPKPVLSPACYRKVVLTTLL